MQVTIKKKKKQTKSAAITIEVKLLQRCFKSIDRDIFTKIYDTSKYRRPDHIYCIKQYNIHKCSFTHKAFWGVWPCAAPCTVPITAVDGLGTLTPVGTLVCTYQLCYCGTIKNIINPLNINNQKSQYHTEIEFHCTQWCHSSSIDSIDINHHHEYSDMHNFCLFDLKTLETGSAY